MLDTTLVLLGLSAFLSGMAGAFLGVGGGIFLVPVMTLGLGIPIRIAIATSLVGVIATSSGAASVYVRDHLTNIRLGMLLEVATTAGAIAGAMLSVLVDQRWLYVTFGVVVLYAALAMLRHRGETARDRAYKEGPEAGLSRRLRLGAVYFDPEDRAAYRYRVARPFAGLGVSACAGAVSGLLGVGGGFIKVPAMTLLMRVPMKVAVATSNFMIGVTAAASAFIYYSRGFVSPELAAVAVVGVYAGTRLGTRSMVRAKTHRVRGAFAATLILLGLVMTVRPFLAGGLPL